MEIESASHYLLRPAARVSVTRWNEFRDFFPKKGFLSCLYDYLKLFLRLHSVWIL